VYFQATPALVVLSGRRRHIHWTKLQDKTARQEFKVLSRKRPRLSDSENELETCKTTESNQERSLNTHRASYTTDMYNIVWSLFGPYLCFSVLGFS